MVTNLALALDYRNVFIGLINDIHVLYISDFFSLLNQITKVLCVKMSNMVDKL